ncbi:PDZ domain-containing protein [Actinomyces slackii]|uniref:ATP-dependent protease Lon n=1 Tax=Actinomyces slackii TaxID=52774 RepID=A0A448KCU2_9ACTO|nr:ATP-dependent protease Lon [Actinomyces slackii]
MMWGVTEPDRNEPSPQPAASAEPSADEIAESAENAESTENADNAESAPTAPPRRPWWRRRRRLLVQLGALAVVVGLIVAAFTVPINQVVIQSPGPTWNVLADGSQEGSEDLLTIEGMETYPAKGELRMTTVTVAGCPGYPVHTADVIAAWFSSSKAILDREQVCPSNVTAEEIEATNQAAMTSSQDSAVVAALSEAGVENSMTLSVNGVSEEQTTSDLQPDDVLVALTPQGGERTAITSFAQLRELMTTIPAGTQVTLDILRDGKATTASLTTIERPEPADGQETQGQTGGSMLGVALHIEVNSDLTVSFTLSDVGGSSAGLMFALGIVDEITPGDMTGGKSIAGTGSIDFAGQVGPIGGIQQKMAGAANDGAKYFLAPVANCDEVVGHEPEGMEVYAVETIHEGTTAVKAIASGDTSGLSTCQQRLDEKG